MKRTTKLLSLLLALAMMLSALVVSALPASAITPLPIVMQNDYKWTGAANTYGSGTLMATGCGIFSLVLQLQFRMAYDHIPHFFHGRSGKHNSIIYLR